MSAGTDERQRAAFAGIVLLMRQLAQQLMENGNLGESRGIVDGLEAIQARTKGNLEEAEAKFLEEILFELRMAVVKGPGESTPDSAEAPEDDPDPAP